MKKLLALVLALVMTLGLATVAANADFKDQSEVNLEQAVKVMSKVGVFKGNENGEFKPTANLDRASAAKLIAYLDLGEKAAEALPAVQVFSDVPASNWAAKYIAYCQNAGYIAGNGSGQFLPSTELTGYAFGKMVLCVLGYDPSIEGYTGANWTINVAKRLQSCGITDGIDSAASATLTREQAAQYCMNALKATMVEYDDKGTTISAGDVTIQTGAKKANDKVVTSADTKWDAIDNAVADNTPTKHIVQLGEKLYDGDLKLDPANNNFGEPGKTWTYKNDEIGTYAKAVDSTLKNGTTGGAVYSAIGKVAIDKVNAAIAAGAAAGAADEIKLFVDGTQVAVANKTTQTINMANLTKGNSNDFTYGAGIKANGNGSTTNVFVEENAGVYTVTISVINSYIAKVASVNAATAKKDRSVNFAKVDSHAAPLAYETEEFAKDDYVLYTGATTAKGWEVQTAKKVTPTDVVDVSSVKDDAGAQASFVGSGTTYKFTKYHDALNNIEIGDSYKLYLDEAGYVAYADLYNDATSYSNYLVIVAEKYNNDALTGKKITVNAITLDGVKLSGITLGKVNTVKIDDIEGLPNGGATAAAKDTIYSFTKDSDGKYNLKTPAAPYGSSKLTLAPAAGFDFHAGTTAMGTNQTAITAAAPVGTNITANNNTKFVVVNTADDNKIYTYDGVANMANIASAATNKAAFLSKTGAPTVAKVVFVNVSAKPVANASQSKDIVYLFNAKFDASKDGDDNYKTYEIIKDGVKTTVTMKDDKAPAATAKGLWWIEETEGNYATKLTDTVVNANVNNTTVPDKYHTYYAANVAGDAKYADGVFTIGTLSKLTDAKTAVYFIDKDENVTTTTVDALESTNTDYEYWIVSKTSDAVETVLAIYIQEN